MCLVLCSDYIIPYIGSALLFYFGFLIKKLEFLGVRSLSSLYFYMQNFTIAHECGHIVHGHLREKSGENCIDEMLQMSNEIEDHERKA